MKPVAGVSEESGSPRGTSQASVRLKKSEWKQLAEGSDNVKKGFGKTYNPNTGKMVDQKEYHAGKHLHKYKGRFKNADEYEAGARSLLNSKVGGNVFGHVRGDGTVVRYDKETRDFVFGNSRVGLVSMYPADKGISYYNYELRTRGFDWASMPDD